MLTPPPSQLWGLTVILTLGSSHVVVGVTVISTSKTNMVFLWGLVMFLHITGGIKSSRSSIPSVCAWTSRRSYALRLVQSRSTSPLDFLRDVKRINDRSAALPLLVVWARHYGKVKGISLERCQLALVSLLTWPPPPDRLAGFCVRFVHLRKRRCCCAASVCAYSLVTLFVAN